MQLKCLIAEDAQFMREIYRYALANHPTVEIVAEASDGEEAIKLLSELKPDVILLDLVLPVKSGLDVLKEISLVSPQTKIVVVSSIEDEQIVAKAKALGALIYIKKPFTKADLLKAFDEAGKTYSEVENG
jgi:two-component system, chemotaxis family, chemotaxis protein CheY